jgi:AraC family transcriptional regulator of adaptative response/methylated-DNA-[protein]-cysteine methyltransferase
VGLIILDFGDNEADLLTLFAMRLPGAQVDRDDVGLPDIARKLEQLVDHRAEDPEIAVDPWRDAYQKQAWSLLREPSAGETTNYDALGMAGAIGLSPIAILIPYHRVVKKDGSAPFYRWGIRRKRALIRREQDVANYRLE